MTRNLLTKFIMGLLTIVLVSCGNFDAAQHPDDVFQNGRGISSLDELDKFVAGENKNPAFRRAEVTTESGPLRLKTAPETSASAPSGVDGNLAKGTQVWVYWPTDVQNNHIKILYKDLTLWVTYQSSAGKKYITLLEEMGMPAVKAPGAGLIKAPVSGVPVGGGDLVTASPTNLDIKSVRLPSTVIDEAFAAIRKMELEPSEVKSCHFDPLVGNSGAGNNCYEKIVISKKFRDFVKSHGHSCAQKAAVDTFGHRPQKIIFHTSYAGQVKRDRFVKNSSKLSMHATGQAFDLFAVSLIFSKSNTRRVTLHKNQTDGSSTSERQNHKFYWGYVKCWQEAVRTHSPCNCSASMAGAITYLDNAAHHNHVHMSLPFCERSRFNVSCV